jgi:hypothetical protein
MAGAAIVASILTGTAPPEGIVPAPAITLKQGVVNGFLSKLAGVNLIALVDARHDLAVRPVC